MKTFTRTTLLAVLTGVAAPALAADMYVAGTLGYFKQKSSTNAGLFATPFTTGSVTGVENPLTLPEGDAVGWRTNFDKSAAYSLALGWRMDAFRFEVEYAMTNADVESHAEVVASDIELANIDAGVLLTGNVGDLGISVGDLVAGGMGRLKTNTFFLNGYYDFMSNEAFSPYLGAGLGYAKAKVRYEPSDVQIIDDSDSTFSYQLMLGASYAFNDNFELYGDVRYRRAKDAAVTSPLLSADFDIQNRGTLYNIGVRYNF